MAVCYRHPNRETNVGCSNCGRSICPDCMTSTPVGMRCPECARQRTRVVRGAPGLGSGDAPVTYALIVMCVAAFAAELATGAELFRGGGSFYRDFGLAGVLVADGEVYRLVTTAFIHYGVIHLGLNMLALYFLGRLLEPAIGAPRLVGIYFVSVLGGSLGVMVLEPNSFAVGASGAVFGLLAAGFLFARDRGLDDLAGQIGFILILNFVFTLSVPNVSLGAHLGGLIAGGVATLFSLAVARQRLPRAVEVGGFVALAAAAFAASLALAPEAVPGLLG